MKKVILAAVMAVGLFNSTPKASAVICFWATEPAWGWDGYGVYSGKACYSDNGLTEMYFKPIIPIITLD